MSDDKENVGQRDRALAAGGGPYEVDAFVNKHGITAAKARKLIERHGADRKALNAAAARLA